MSGSMFLPQRVEVTHRQIGPVHVFTGDAVPGLHVAAVDLRQAFDLLEPVASEIMRRMTRLGVRYRADETFAGFHTRRLLLSALRPQGPKAAPGLFQEKFLSRRRLMHALAATGAEELGKRDRHAAYWRSRQGIVFSVMGPQTRNQKGELLYTEGYARDLLSLVAGLGEAGPSPARGAEPGAPADLVLTLVPV